jgi:hypothetical protein
LLLKRRRGYYGYPDAEGRRVKILIDTWLSPFGKGIPACRCSTEASPCLNYHWAAAWGRPWTELKPE